MIENEINDFISLTETDYHFEYVDSSAIVSAIINGVNEDKKECNQKDRLSLFKRISARIKRKHGAIIQYEDKSGVYLRLKNGSEFMLVTFNPLPDNHYKILEIIIDKCQ